MAEKKVTKAKAKVTKAKVTKKATKPKTMAARRPTTETESHGEVFKVIVEGVLQTRKKSFTSSDIANTTSASKRHSRRVLATLAGIRALKVTKGKAPYIYSVAQREYLKSVIR